MSGIEITNKSLTIDFAWGLTDAEVDIVSKIISGKKKSSKIKEEDVYVLLQSVFDYIISTGITKDNALEISVAQFKKDGKSEDWIKSYTRGWNLTGKAIGK